jgi:hypothetical protein
MWQHRTKLGHVMLRHYANHVMILVGISVLIMIRLMAAQDQTLARRVLVQHTKLCQYYPDRTCTKLTGEKKNSNLIYLC